MDESRGSDPMNPTNPVLTRHTSPVDRSSGHFVAPLGSVRSGHLRFTNGAHQIVIRAESRLRSLCRAHFRKRTPTVSARRGVVTVRYTGFPTGDWLYRRSERPAEVALNTRIPWDIEVRGGASRLVADLRGLRLGSLMVDGGASRLEVILPAPSGNVTVLIRGGASNVAVHHPEGVSARLCVDGGVTNLKVYDRHVGAAGGELDLRSAGYGGTTDRYDITITGGANNLSVERRRGEERGEP
jgi:hypothetical protein